MWAKKSYEYEPNTLKVNAKKKTLNENFSMAMYALVRKSMQFFFENN